MLIYLISLFTGKITGLNFPSGSERKKYDLLSRELIKPHPLIFKSMTNMI